MAYECVCTPRQIPVARIPSVEASAYLVDGKLRRFTAASQSEVVGCAHHLDEADASVEVLLNISQFRRHQA